MRLSAKNNLLILLSVFSINQYVYADGGNDLHMHGCVYLPTAPEEPMTFIMRHTARYCMYNPWPDNDYIDMPIYVTHAGMNCSNDEIVAAFSYENWTKDNHEYCYSKASMSNIAFLQTGGQGIYNIAYDVWWGGDGDKGLRTGQFKVDKTGDTSKLQICFNNPVFCNMQADTTYEYEDNQTAYVMYFPLGHI